MANCGNFLEYAANECGIDVGFGKMLLIFKEKTSVPKSALTAEAINAKIVSGDIIGIVKNWISIAGAPVAEVSVERTATKEMKLIHAEINADTLTFESNLVNREVISDLVKAGSLNCLVIDDLGNVFGEKATKVDEISTMLLNFSSKVTASFQFDNTNEKTIAVTVRYLVKNLDFVAGSVEVELVNFKKMLNGYLQSVTTLTATSAVFVLALKQKGNAKIYEGAIDTSDVTVTGGNITTKTANFVTETGLLTIELAGTGFAIPEQTFNVAISTDDAYMKETSIGLGE